MRRIAWVSIVFALSLFGPVLWYAVKETYNGWRSKERASGELRLIRHNRELNEQLPPPFLLRPDDDEAYPRESFSLLYEEPRGFRVDTAQGTVTQDRIVDPDTTIALRLSELQMDMLYQTVLVNRLFEMSQPVPQEFWPLSIEHGSKLTLRAGTARRSFRWIPDSNHVLWTDDQKRLTEVIDQLLTMVKGSREYRALPKPKGLYID